MECPNCAQLELENEMLREEIERLNRAIKVLKKKLEIIRKYVQEVMSRAGVIISQKSGVPRGKWSFAKAAYSVADKVNRILGCS